MQCKHLIFVQVTVLIMAGQLVGCASKPITQEQKCEWAHFEERAQKVVSLFGQRTLANVEKVPRASLKDAVLNVSLDEDTSELVLDGAKRELVIAQRTSDWVGENFTVTTSDSYQLLQDRLGKYANQWVAVFGWTQQKKYTKTYLELDRLISDAKQIDQTLCKK